MFETWMLLRESQIGLLLVGIAGMIGLLVPIVVICVRAYIRGLLLAQYRQAYRSGRTSGYMLGWKERRLVHEAHRREELANARRRSEPRGDAGPNARVSKARISSKD